MALIDWSGLKKFFNMKEFRDEINELYIEQTGYTRTSVTWNLTGVGKQDIKDLFKVTPSQQAILQKWTDEIVKGIDSNDDKVWAIARAVNRRIKYAFDIDNWKRPDYWADPFTVWTKQTDDCDGYAALIFYCMKLAGIQEARRRFACGYVNDLKGNNAGGHAYVLYWSEKWNAWFPVEGSYYASKAEQNYKEGIDYSSNGLYERPWFSTNETSTFSQTDGYVIPVFK